MRRRLIGLLVAAVLFGVTGRAAIHQDKPKWVSRSEVTLAFPGDVHFEGRVDRLLADPTTAFGPAAAQLATADLAMVNLETPITDGGIPEPKPYLFRARKAAVPALVGAGIDVVTLANNHTLDYGRQGLADTIAVAHQGGLVTVGAGANADEAFRPVRVTVRGVRIAILAFSQVDELAQQWAARPDRAGIAMAFDTARVRAAVRQARVGSDLVIVLAHWGTEGDSCPDPRQRNFANMMVTAGADIVIGAHVHVLQGAGRAGGAYIAYGLGNFLWYSSGLYPPYSSRGGILRLVVRGHEVVRSDFLPTVVSATGQSVEVSGWQKRIAQRNFDSLRGCAGLAR
jgi:poly-gamma-glutamate capsule biosynthesis protein CapA/YwtB (metallophosphatase superfamily)